MRRLVYGENARVGAWLKSRGVEYRDGGQCIGLERDGELVAGVLFDHYNGASVFVHVALDKHGLNRELLRAAFSYAFHQLAVNVLIGLVAEDNRAAQRFDEHLGFTLEHSIAGADPSGATRIYTMRKHECRWLDHG